MIEALARRFLSNPENIQDPAVRRGYGVLCGAVGIGLNLLLFAGKCIAGLLSGSVAITADAFNNLSDAGSSVVTLLGFKLSAHAPDRGHPFGHGRLEYISGLVVSMVIVLMGVGIGIALGIINILEEVPGQAKVPFPVFLLLALAAAVAFTYASFRLSVYFYRKRQNGAYL